MRVAGEYGRAFTGHAETAHRANLDATIASERKRDAAAASRHKFAVATRSAARTSTAAGYLKTARAHYDGKATSWASRHNPTTGDRAWRRSEEGRAALGALGRSGAIYQAAVQDELRVAAEETDGDRENVRKAIASRAAEIKVRDGREDDAGGLIDGAVNAAADRVSSESPAMRLVAARISETGEALNRAAVGLKTVPQPSGSTAFDAARAAFDEAVMNEFNLALERLRPLAAAGRPPRNRPGTRLL